MEAESVSPPRSRQDQGPPPIACDTCYTRKIRCDRKSPCGNCQDSQISCRRERQRSERKPKENSFPPEIFDALHEIKSRMIALENTVSQSIALSNSNASSSRISSNPLEKSSRQEKKRTSAEAFGVDTPPRDSPYIKTGSDYYSTPPFSTYEAQSLIRQELSSTPDSSKTKRTALHSALLSLKQKLNTTVQHLPNDVNTLEELQSLPMPPIELIQWMLQSKESGRAVVSGSDFMPFTSRETIARMARDFMANQDHDVEPSSVICVAAYGGYFLQEIVLLGSVDETGMEDRLRSQAYDYFKTARAWTPYMLRQLPTTLSSLQALVYCFLLAQERGDFVTASTLVDAACKLCKALGLHKRINNFSTGSIAVAAEAYNCFATCYLNDKGLAMNLSTIPFLDDTIIEIDVLKSPAATGPVLDNFHLYLRLAQIQGSIIKELRSTAARRQRQEILTEILLEMDTIWNLYQELHIINKPESGEYDSDLESTLVEIAYFSIQTVIYQSSGIDTLKDSTRKEARLEAARTTLLRIQRAQALSKTSQYNSAYLKSSFTNWVILYYPFTPFFVLFCNVIQSRDRTDYDLMQQFVAYLAEMKDISISVEKLHELCLPFCALASTLLRSDEETNLNENPSIPKSSLWTEKAQRPPPPQLYLREQDAQPAPISAHVQASSYGNQTGFMQDTSNYAVPPIPYDMVGADGNYDFNTDPFVWDFMSTQPMLQWLDSDFSVLEPPM
ncbi:hypothetical protein BKA61DRAFT_150913 [Leptodontidium sp. MPI-SDFR-AT-0119]|nr:hypothetical protein BKA61DRAFT_150913 [Leptodontidium sp. MPI-SDFR-AT-0119]